MLYVNSNLVLTVIPSFLARAGALTRLSVDPSPAAWLELLSNPAHTAALR